MDYSNIFYCIAWLKIYYLKNRQRAYVIQVNALHFKYKTVLDFGIVIEENSMIHNL